MLKIAVWCLTSPEKHFITLRPLVAALHHAQPRVRCQARRAHGGTGEAIGFCRHRGRITYFFYFLVLFCWLVSVGFSLVRVDMIGDAVLLCLFDLSCCTVRVAGRVKVSDRKRGRVRF